MERFSYLFENRSVLRSTLGYIVTVIYCLQMFFSIILGKSFADHSFVFQIDKSCDILLYPRQTLIFSKYTTLSRFFLFLFRVRISHKTRRPFSLIGLHFLVMLRSSNWRSASVFEFWLRLVYFMLRFILNCLSPSSYLINWLIRDLFVTLACRFQAYRQEVIFSGRSQFLKFLQTFVFRFRCYL